MSDRYATIRAQLALKGFTLVRADDDAGRLLFIVSKQSLTRQLHGMPELERFAALVTVRRQAPTR